MHNENNSLHKSFMSVPVAAKLLQKNQIIIQHITGPRKKKGKNHDNHNLSYTGNVLKTNANLASPFVFLRTTQS